MPAAAAAAARLAGRLRWNSSSGNSGGRAGRGLADGGLRVICIISGKELSGLSSDESKCTSAGFLCRDGQDMENLRRHRLGSQKKKGTLD